MNVKLLIDAIIHQTTILIAHLATTAGLRAPLAHVANQVFLDLVVELENQGLGRKVVADMFGLALRSYQLKVRRLSESSTEQSRSLWEAVLDHIQEQDLVTRAEIQKRFARDDERSVRGILHDLVESGLVFRTGRGSTTTYRATTKAELDRTWAADPEAATASLCWVAVYRNGPLTCEQLVELLGLEPELAQRSLDALAQEGRVTRQERLGQVSYRADTCVIPMGEPSGWEAAVFDHYQAMVAGLCNKLRSGDTTSFPKDVIGGSTWSFDVWPGHPYEERVYGQLRELRAQVSDLRTQVTHHNQSQSKPSVGVTRVVLYVGQNAIRDTEMALEQED